MENKYTVSLLVNNKPGVLVRVAQTFARRGFNVDSLVVSPAHNHNFSRITIVIQGSLDTLDQILRQLNKLVDVMHASNHDHTNALERELALFKVKVTPEKRTEVFQIVEVFRAKTIDITDQSIIIEVTGDTSKIDALESLLSSIGIIEMVRTGKIIIARGMEET